MNQDVLNRASSLINIARTDPTVANMVGPMVEAVADWRDIEKAKLEAVRAAGPDSTDVKELEEEQQQIVDDLEQFLNNDVISAFQERAENQLTEREQVRFATIVEKSEQKRFAIQQQRSSQRAAASDRLSRQMDTLDQAEQAQLDRIDSSLDSLALDEDKQKAEAEKIATQRRFAEQRRAALARFSREQAAQEERADFDEAIEIQQVILQADSP